MICPSCNYVSTDPTAFCIRCGISLARYGSFLRGFRSTFTWILRRSLAGLAAGMAGWFVIPAAGRAAGASLSQAEHLLLTAGLGGIFLGTVEGMMEESVLKTVRGGLAGALGALFGALIGIRILNGRTDSSVGMVVVVLTWSMAGLCIGTISAWLERRKERLIAGAVAGWLGGALGGWLGYQMYASLSDIARTELWGVKRLIEGSTGAVAGAVLWFVLALAEKWLIFRRREVHNISYKECDVCHHSNVLKAWYCAACGSVLQVSAPPEKLDLPKRQALARFISACQYLGRLSATTSIVVAALALVFLGSINPFLGLFGLLVTALIGYISYVLLNTLAEVLSPIL